MKDATETAGMIIIVLLLIACILFAAYSEQPLGPSIVSETLTLPIGNPTVTPETFDIDTSLICYGTFEFASGTVVDDCTESYEITSESLFIITDGHGRKMVARGPLNIEAHQYIDFDEPMCIKDFEGYEYRFRGDSITISNEYLCNQTTQQK